MVMSADLYDTPISAAESTRHSWDEESQRQARQHDLAIRKLELEVLKTEAKFNNWFKIPLVIIKLPIYLIMSIGFIVAMIRKHDPGEDFWRLMK